MRQDQRQPHSHPCGSCLLTTAFSATHSHSFADPAWAQAWHDSGTFDKNIRAWPACGGANGSIRFDVRAQP